MTSIYTQETMLFHTTLYVTNRSAECGFYLFRNPIVLQLTQLKELIYFVNFPLIRDNNRATSGNVN